MIKMNIQDRVSEKIKRNEKEINFLQTMFIIMVGGSILFLLTFLVVGLFFNL